MSKSVKVARTLIAFSLALAAILAQHGTTVPSTHVHASFFKTPLKKSVRNPFARSKNSEKSLLMDLDDLDDIPESNGDMGDESNGDMGSDSEDESDSDDVRVRNLARKANRKANREVGRKEADEMDSALGDPDTLLDGTWDKGISGAPQSQPEKRQPEKRQPVKGQPAKRPPAPPLPSSPQIQVQPSGNGPIQAGRALSPPPTPVKKPRLANVGGSSQPSKEGPSQAGRALGPPPTPARDLRPKAGGSSQSQPDQSSEKGRLQAADPPFKSMLRHVENPRPMKVGSSSPARPPVKSPAEAAQFFGVRLNPVGGPKPAGAGHLLSQNAAAPQSQPL